MASTSRRRATWVRVCVFVGRRRRSRARRTYCVVVGGFAVVRRASRNRRARTAPLRVSRSRNTQQLEQTITTPIFGRVTNLPLRSRDSKLPPSHCARRATQKPAAVANSLRTRRPPPSRASAFTATRLRDTEPSDPALRRSNRARARARKLPRSGGVARTRAFREQNNNASEPSSYSEPGKPLNRARADQPKMDWTCVTTGELWRAWQEVR